MSFLEMMPAPCRRGAVKAAETLKTLDDVIIAAHVGMDGDALGSVAAIGWLMKGMDKRFALYSSTGIPKNMDFLLLPGPMRQTIAEIPFVVRSAVYLDCSQARRLGQELEALVDELPSVNIDHHPAERGLGSLCNYIRPEAAATAQLVSYVSLAMDVMPKGLLADGIALGLMTDTGGFCHGNTTSDVFALCALLAKHGCDIPRLREELQNNWSLNRVHLWGLLLSRISLHDDGRIAFCPVCLGDLEKFHCFPEDLEGLVEWVRKIKGVKVAMTLREETENRCKFSLRSFGDIDVRAMAASLGGGGHFNASGGILEMPLPEASGVLLKAVSRHLRHSGQ